MRMRAAEAFFDTSVILYLLSHDEAKADRVEVLLPRKGIISVRVLNEIASVALRKHALSFIELRNFLSAAREFCAEIPVTIETHELGLKIAERYGFGLYDSMNVASALVSGCRVLYSEDLQDGQLIEKSLKVVNPFKMK